MLAAAPVARRMELVRLCNRITPSLGMMCCIQGMDKDTAGQTVFYNSKTSVPSARNLSTSICNWFQCLTSLMVLKFFIMAKMNICCYNFKLLFSFTIPSERGKAVNNLPLLK